jgi:charged multivesicular body protein 1
MFSTNNKIFDQIFELKFLSKQLVKESKRCESEESSQKLKAKQAMVKGLKIFPCQN